MDYMPEEFDIDFFRDTGFMRKQCISCSSYFWTLDSEKKTCGDPACESYSFIGNSPVYRKYTIDEMREEFIKFFQNDSEFRHKFIPAYPVVPRWRDDVLLVNASIYDFQPQVTSGLVPPPGNPIVMSQPSIRMLDLDLVGKTGRHLTTFEMLCHDAFNYEDKFVYWKNETIRYSFRFLTERLKVDKNLITYKEKPWFGGGNAGNAVEVFVRGLEVATLVFMDLKEDPNGDVEIEGTKYSHMPLRVVDTGYGLERLVWLSAATSTIYDAIYDKTINFLIENSKAKKINDKIMAKISEISAVIDPYSEEKVMNEVKKFMESKKMEYNEDFIKQLKFLREVYSLADHTKTLLLMFSDYVIPSNVKVGYLARTLIRRSFRFIDDIGFKYDLEKLLEFQYGEFKNIIPRFDEKFISDIIKIEREKYNAVNQSSFNIVKKFIKDDDLPLDSIIRLYESYGINEDLISDIYHQITGKTLIIPDNFHELIIKNKEIGRKETKKQLTFPDIKTRPLYYDNTKILEFTANVLYSCDKKIILNQTAFYPEGGGQPYDLGYFIYNGKRINVLNVQKYGDSIVHFLDSDIPEHSRIKGVVDYNRRHQLMIHHSATHLLLGVMRSYFGDHVWQSGVKKDVNESRLDITHYKKITEEDIKNIEDLCFRAIEDGKTIRVTNEKWNTALDKYGFRLFEGGVPVSKTIRVVTIQDIDSEGCGGTHLDNTSEIHFIKIIKTETLQEGIQRVTFAAGPAALRYVQKLYNIIKAEQEYMRVDEDKIANQSKKYIEELISLRKTYDDQSREITKNIINNPEKINNINVYNIENYTNIKLLISALQKFNQESIVINRLQNEVIIYIISGQASSITDSLISLIKNNGIEPDRVTKSHGICIMNVNNIKNTDILLDSIKKVKS